ncbi:hypothetical protein [Nocardia sp. MW-W600-9]
MLLDVVDCFDGVSVEARSWAMAVNQAVVAASGVSPLVVTETVL